MSRYSVSCDAVIPAPPARVYNVIADYRQHHPRIVPPEYFGKLEVVEGGVGAGTRVRFETYVLGTTRQFEHVVSEPEPGRVLVEMDVDRSIVTRFTVESLDGGSSTHLTIASDVAARPGIAGRLERFMVSMMMRRIYRLELARIEQYVAQTMC